MEGFGIHIILVIWSLGECSGTSITCVLHDMAIDELMGSIHDITNSHLDHYYELGWCPVRLFSNILSCRTLHNHIFLLIKFLCPRLNGQHHPARPTFSPSCSTSVQLPFSAPPVIAYTRRAWWLDCRMYSLLDLWVEGGRSYVRYPRRSQLWASHLGFLAWADLSRASSHLRFELDIVILWACSICRCRACSYEPSCMN